MKAIDVLKAGQSLEDPANWKRVQQYSTAVLFAAGLVAEFAPLPFSSGQLNALSYGCGVLIYFINAYLTVATTTKIGIDGVPPKEPNS